MIMRCGARSSSGQGMPSAAACRVTRHWYLNRFTTVIAFRVGLKCHASRLPRGIRRPGEQSGRQWCLEQGYPKFEQILKIADRSRGPPPRAGLTPGVEGWDE